MSSEIDPDLQNLIDSLPQTKYGEQQVITNGKMVLEFFPEGYIALNRELATGLHKKLEKLLEVHPVEETDIRLAEIASYCSVVLDGTYTIGERDKLCFILAGRLEALREMPVNVSVN